MSTAMMHAFHGFSEQGKVLVNTKAWLGRIVYNACMDIHRERQRFVQPPEEPEPEPLPALVSMDGTPDRELLERERSREIQTRIQALPPNLRAPLEMRFLRGMSYVDIAAQLRLTNCNVRKRIQLAYNLLRTSLADMRHDR